MTSGSLWNYYRDEVNDLNEINHVSDYRINNKATSTKCFDYEAKIIENKPDNNSRLDAEFVVPLENLSNFQRSLVLPLINYEIGLDLS